MLFSSSSCCFGFILNICLGVDVFYFFYGIYLFYGLSFLIEFYFFNGFNLLKDLTYIGRTTLIHLNSSIFLLALTFLFIVLLLHPSRLIMDWRCWSDDFQLVNLGYICLPPFYLICIYSYFFNYLLLNRLFCLHTSIFCCFFLCQRCLKDESLVIFSFIYLLKII